MFGVRLNQVKTLFFDRDVTNAVDRGTKKVLSKFGAFVRRTAKRSMRKARRKKRSEMGPDELKVFGIREAIAKRESKSKPKRPLASSKPGEPPRTRLGLIKKFIFFFYDPQPQSVVIGPIKLNKEGDAPEVLEFGGVTRSTTTGKRITIEARPYMGPAYKKEQPKLAGMWRDVVKG